MSEFSLFIIGCDLGADDPRRDTLVEILSAHGRCATSLSSQWLLAIDADVVESQMLHAGVLLEELLDVLGQDASVTIVEVDNIATYNIQAAGEELLDSLFPVEEE